MLKTDPAAISSTEFFDRSRARLGFDVPPGLIDPNIIPKSGDQGTDRMLEIIAREQPVRPAAVLIPVVDHPQPTILLTQRAAHLNDHAGQISFPGGKIDMIDASPLDAALREAEEEIGLDPAQVKLGEALPPTRTFVTNYVVHPFVGYVPHSGELDLQPNPTEVETVLTFSLELLREGYEMRRLVRRGVPIHTPTYEVEGHLIWGATARILADFLSHLQTGA